MRHGADEFSLRITWRPHQFSRDRNERTVVPGFYISAGFANEGEAYEVIDNVLLRPQALTNVFLALSHEEGIDAKLMNLAKPLTTAVEAAQQTRLVRLAEQLRATREALAKHEEALRAAGLDPDAV